MLLFGWDGGRIVILQDFAHYKEGDTFSGIRIVPGSRTMMFADHRRSGGRASRPTWSYAHDYDPPPDDYVPPPRKNNQWYSILGLQLGASPDEIKSAYRRLARLHHPDVGGTVEMMAEINRAYEDGMKYHEVPF